MNLNMEARVVSIDKSMATEMMKRNMVNRSLSPGRVAQYAESLRKGDWQLNGESIKFNKRGELIDGQHRLSAVISVGVPMITAVMTNIDDDVSVMDRGRNRNVTDSLIIEGIDKSVANTRCVSMARLNYAIQSKSTPTHNVSDTYIREWILSHSEELTEVHNIFKIVSGGKGITKSTKTTLRSAPIALAFYYAINTEVSSEEARQFLKILHTGFYDNRNETSAIVLRNDLISGNIDAGSGNVNERVNAVYSVEKALYDFHHSNERKITYKNIDKPTYSNNAKFKEV